MRNDQIIRAWKDEEYRNSLTPAQRARIPKNPAGLIDLEDAEMQAAVGGSLGVAAGGGGAKAPITQNPQCTFYNCQTRIILCKA
jgi:mersacidin/lichenicidin family type 2 lantibiotic